MSWRLFTKIVDEASLQGVCSLRLCWRGEPLLHPQLVEMAAYAKSKGLLDVYFNTNGSLLDCFIAQGLVRSGLDRITFSIEGFSKDIYEKYRCASNFERVLANVRGLAQIRKDLHSDRPRIRIQAVTVPEVTESKTQYASFWGEFADEITFLDYRDEGRDFSGMVASAWQCPYLWLRLSIAFDGSIYPCCFVSRADDQYSMSSCLGNIESYSLQDAWRSEQLESYRMLHKEGRSHEIGICDWCSYRGTDILKDSCADGHCHS